MLVGLVQVVMKVKSKLQISLSELGAQQASILMLYADPGRRVSATHAELSASSGLEQRSRAAAH